MAGDIAEVDLLAWEIYVVYCVYDTLSSDLADSLLNGTNG